MKIEKDRVVGIQYHLTNKLGETLDQSKEGEPLMYLHGKGNIIPGLEEALLGLSKGDKTTAEILPEKAYGLPHKELVISVPRTSVPDAESLKVGNMLQVKLSDGSPLPVKVTELNAEQVTLDGNHPLAGETLIFNVEIMEVRAAEPEEIAHGHVHGPGGHHH